MTHFTRIATLFSGLLVASSIGLGLFSSLPNSAAALSCAAPEMMIPLFAEESEYTVALVTAGELTTQGDQHAQTVTTELIYKGELSATATVKFAYNETWQYMCAGNPATAGEKALYVLHDKSVVQVLAPDSELARELISLLPEPTSPATSTANNPANTGTTNTIDKIKQQIINLLEQLIAWLSL